MLIVVPDAAMPPLALSSRHLPSSHQLSHRLGQLAKAYDLTLAPDAFAEIGDFMAVGMDAHLGDILHGIVHMTGRERPGEDTIRVPKGIKPEPDLDPLEMGIDVHGSDGHAGFVDSIKREADPTNAYTYTEMPKPDIETFQNLFLMMPGLHPQASPALYRLETSLTRAEADLNNPVKMERKPSPSLPPSPKIGDMTLGMTVPTSPKKAMAIGRTTANRAEAVAKELLESGLLKLDKAGRQSEPGEAEGKKDKKHNLHWKYEDPALILRDILG
jgi:transcriptional coactivator HFI1/ADA1